MNKTNPALIGAFVIGGICLLLFSVIYFAHLSTKGGRPFIIYFTESTNGLNVGAPVKMGGVSIGTVTDIVVLADQETARVVTPVIIEVEEGKIFNAVGQAVNVGSPAKKTGQDIAQMGLRAQLNLQSLVTGQLYVDIEFHPETTASLLADHFSFRRDLAEIPSIPSGKERLSNTVEMVVAEFRKLPIHDTSESVLASMKRIEFLLSRPELLNMIEGGNIAVSRLNQTLDSVNTRLGPILTHLDQTLLETQQMVHHVNQELPPVIAHLDKTILDGDSTLVQASSTLRWLDDPRTHDALQNSLDELASTARSVRTLSDFIQRHPNSLITGKSSFAD